MIRQPPKRCGWCGAPVVWVVMEQTRRHMPLDPDPDPGGTIERFGPGGLRGRVVPRDERDGDRSLYVSHFATCPESRKSGRVKDGRPPTAA